MSGAALRTIPLLAALALPSMAMQAAMLGPGDQLIVTFTSQKNASKVLFFNNSRSLTVTGSPVFTTSLYDGQTLLGTYTAAPFVYKNGTGKVSLFETTFVATGTAPSATLRTPIPFTSINAGTITGKLITTVSGGSVSGFDLTDFHVHDGTLTATGSTYLADVTSDSVTLQTDPSPNPSISSVSPDSAAVGGSAFPLTVNGTGFVSGASVQLGGVPLATSFVSATQLTAAVPAALIALPGAPSVTVLNPGGAGSNPVVFALPFSPGGQLVVKFAAKPNTGAALIFENFDTLTISGSPVFTTSLYDGSTLLGTHTAAPFLYNTGGNGGVPTYLSAFVPSGENHLAFSGYNPTRIPFASIADGTITGRLVTTVSGGSVSGFYAADISLFDAALTNDGYSHRSLTDVTISQASFQANLSPPSGPIVTALSSNSAAVGSPGFTLTVSGSGFVSNSVVLWNGVALTTSFVSAAQLSAIVPAALLASFGKSSLTVLNPDGAGSSPVDFNVPFGPGDQLTDTFTAAPNAADLLLYFGNDSLTIAGSPVFTTSLYDGQTLLGTYTAQPLPNNGASRFSATFASPGSTYASVDDYVKVPFTSINAGTTAGRLVTTVSGGSVWGFNPANLRLHDGISSGQGYILRSDFTVSGRSALGNSSPPPAPSITGLRPDSSVAAGPAFTLTVNGSGFVSSATVLWNGVPLPTSLVSAEQVTASVPVALIASTGTADVTVLNSGGAASSALTFAILSTLPTVPSITTVVSAADLKSEQVPAGAWITILGQNFGAAATASASTTTLGGASVTICETPAVLSYNSGPVIANGSTSWQINALLPDAIAGQTPCPVVVTVDGKSSQPVSVAIVAGTMAIFEFTSSEGILPMITHPDSTLVGPASAGLVPAAPNETVAAMGTGDCTTPVVTVGGSSAEVVASERVAPGLCQISFVVPADSPAGSNPLGFSTSPKSYDLWVSR